MRCARCSKDLAPGEQTRVPRWLAALAAFGLALGHAGLWAQDTLKKDYCARCRRVFVALAAAVVAGAAAAAGLGAAVWIHAARVARSMQGP